MCYYSPHYFFLPNTRCLGYYHDYDRGDGVGLFDCLKKGKLDAVDQSLGGVHNIQEDRAAL